MAFDELIDCCNENSQCYDRAGLDIVNVGCVREMCIQILVKKSYNSLSLSFTTYITA